MYFILKFFDRSVWVKQLSFLGKLDIIQNLPFEKFVLDTRYTINLLALTFFVLFSGAVIYLGLSFAFGSKEVWTFIGLLRRIFIRRKVTPIPKKETEPVSPIPTDTTT